MTGGCSCKVTALTNWEAKGEIEGRRDVVDDNHCNFHDKAVDLNTDIDCLPMTPIPFNLDVHLPRVLFPYPSNVRWRREFSSDENVSHSCDKRPPDCAPIRNVGVLGYFVQVKIIRHLFPTHRRSSEGRSSLLSSTEVISNG